MIHCVRSRCRRRAVQRSRRLASVRCGMHRLTSRYRIRACTCTAASTCTSSCCTHRWLDERRRMGRQRSREERVEGQTDVESTRVGPLRRRRDSKDREQQCATDDIGCDFRRCLVVMLCVRVRGVCVWVGCDVRCEPEAAGRRAVSRRRLLTLVAELLADVCELLVDALLLRLLRRA